MLTQTAGCAYRQAGGIPRESAPTHYYLGDTRLRKTPAGKPAHPLQKYRDLRPHDSVGCWCGLRGRILKSSCHTGLHVGEQATV